MLRPLRVEVLGEPATPEVVRAFDDARERLRYELLPPQSPRALVERWRESAPDVVLVIGNATAAQLAAWWSGVRVAWLPSGSSASTVLPVSKIPNAVLASDDLGRLASRLAEAAGRPGAGLSAAHPVSVVTTVLNEEAALGQLLDALTPQLGPEDELVVVDGGSIDGTVDLLRQVAARDPRVRLVEAPGSNIPSGRNAGVKAARYDVVCCTDAGCVPSGEWLDSLKAAFADDDPPALVTGLYRVVSRTPLEHAMAVGCYPDVDEARRPRPLVRAYGALFGRTFDPTLPTGRSVAFSRDAWMAVGGFPTELDTGEDVAFGRAVAALGKRCVLATDAVVEWQQRPTITSTARMYFRYGLGGARSGDPLVAGRDLARAVAAVGAPLALASGPPALRRAVVLGAGVYLSLPLRRALRRRPPIAVASLTPFAIAVKDIAKAAGFLAGLAVRGGSARRCAP